MTAPIASASRTLHQLPTDDAIPATSAGSESSGSAQQSSDPLRAPVIALRGASVVGDRGTVFGPLEFTSDAAATLVVGARGSGRTCLLLTIAGRMRPDEGAVEVLGESRASAIRRRVGIAGFDDIDALEPQVALGDAIRERVAWVLPWYRRAPRITDALASDLLGEVFAERPLPPVTTAVHDLEPVDEMLVRAGLALLEEPELLVIDDLDNLKNPEDRARFASSLARLSSSLGTGIVAATSDPADPELFAPLTTQTLRL